MSQIDRLYRRIMMMVAPVKITATDDSGPIHRVQVRVTPSETIDNVATMQIYGLASHQPIGTDATAVFVGGQRSNVVIIATGNQQFRLRNLARGEVALYTDEGDKLVFKRGKVVELTCGEHVHITTKLCTVTASDKVRMETPRLECTGDIVDHCDTNPRSMLGMREVFDPHVHSNAGGSGNSGPPTTPMDRPL